MLNNNGIQVPFTSVYAGKYGQKTNQKQTLLKNMHNPENANNTKHSRSKLAWFSRLI